MVVVDMDMMGAGTRHVLEHHTDIECVETPSIKKQGCYESLREKHIK